MPARPVILCIDDNVSGLFTRKLLLESKGFQVLTADNGPAGLDIVRRGPVAAVILDYKMPGMSGDTLARILRHEHPEIPILLLSGFPSEIPDSLLALVDGFITKGDAVNTLVNEVERVTGVKAKPPADAGQIMDSSKKAVARSQDVLQSSRELMKDFRKRRKD